MLEIFKHLPENENTENNFTLRLQFEGESEPSLLEVSSLFYELTLVHDFSLLLTKKEYFNYNFSQFFYYRNGRPIKEAHKIRALSINKNSPLDLTLIISTLGGLLVLLQIIEKSSTIMLNREKIKEEIKKLKLENSTLERESELRNLELDNLIKNEEEHKTLLNLIRRIDKVKFKIKELEVKKRK